MSRSMPSIFLDKKGEVKAVFGAAGGFFIPSAIVMVKTISQFILREKQSIFSLEIFHDYFKKTISIIPHYLIRTNFRADKFSRGFIFAQLSQKFEIQY